jgi:hypothetical protein
MIKKIIYCTFIIFLCFHKLQAQEVKLIRTDCDTNRSAFITSGYLFGFDVVALNISNVYRFLCEIEYDNIDFIQYSGWQAKNFGDNTYIFPNPQTDSLANKGNIAVVALLSEPNENIYYNNPDLIHFDFVVSQTAKHNSVTTFYVKNIKAYININGIDSIINIKPVTYKFTTHGYIEIWPGDANNDGIVNNNDFYGITNLLGQGSAIKSSKSFKREPASTLWLAQRVLAWDSIVAAYSDCDGNGDVTPLDMLVVFLNFNKSHIVTPIVSPMVTQVIENHLHKNDNNLLGVYPKNSKSIPININTSKSIIGTVTKVTYNLLSNDCCLMGVSKGEIFNGDNSELIIDAHHESGFLNIITGTKNPDEQITGSGVLFNLIVSNEIPYPLENSFHIEEIYAITNKGEIVRLDEIISNVEMTTNSINDEIKIYESDGKLILNNKSKEIFEGKISIYNSLGECIIFDENFVKSNEEIQIDIPIKLLSGRYFVIIKNRLKVIAVPFSLIH